METRAEGWERRRWNREFSTKVEPGARAMKPGDRALDHGIRWLKIGTRAGNRGLARGPGGLRGSGGAVSNSDSESNLVTEPWLGQCSLSSDGESCKSTVGTGGWGGEIGVSF